MKTLSLFLVLCLVSFAAESVDRSPIVVGAYYAPAKAEDPFHPHEFYAHVLAVKDGWVKFEVVMLNFKRITGEPDSLKESVFRLSYPVRAYKP